MKISSITRKWQKRKEEKKESWVLKLTVSLLILIHFPVELSLKNQNVDEGQLPWIILSSLKSLGIRYKITALACGCPITHATGNGESSCLFQLTATYPSPSINEKAYKTTHIHSRKHRRSNKRPHSPAAECWPDEVCVRCSLMRPLCHQEQLITIWRCQQDQSWWKFSTSGVSVYFF